jgi:hypothetical protein
LVSAAASDKLLTWVSTQSGTWYVAAKIISGRIDDVAQPERESRRRCQSVGSAVRAGNLYSKPDAYAFGKDRDEGQSRQAVGERRRLCCRRTCARQEMDLGAATSKTLGSHPSVIHTSQRSSASPAGSS